MYILLLLFFNVLCITGCKENESRIRTSNRAIVFGLAIEKKEDTYIGYTQNISYTKGGEEKAYSYEIVEVKAGTIYELLDNLLVLNQKSTLWKHLQVLIVHESIANHDLIIFSEYFERNPQFPITFGVVYTEDKLNDLLETTSGTFPIPAMSIQNLLFEQTLGQYALPIRFFEIMREVETPFHDYYLPVIELKNKELRLSGTAVFKDHEFAGKLNEQDTQNVKRLIEKPENTWQIFSYQPTSSPEDVQLATRIEHSRVKMVVHLEYNLPSIHIELNEKFKIETHAPIQDLTAEDITHIEKAYNKQVEEELQATIHQVQKEWNANILGFADLVARQQPQYWKAHKQEWNDIYRELKVEVRVTSELTHTGLTRRFSPKITEEES